MLYEATQDNSKTDEKQGCYSLQLLTDLAHGRRELKACSCASVFGGDVKRDCVLENIGLQFELHVQEKRFLEFEHWIFFLYNKTN
jgi:hypothetical protein